MPDVNVASRILETLQDVYGLMTAKLAEASDYTCELHEGRRPVRRVVTSYVFDVDGESIRIDVVRHSGVIYRGGCGGSTPELIRHARDCARYLGDRK